MILIGIDATNYQYLILNPVHEYCDDLYSKIGLEHHL